jgi:hypothetical protein
MFSLSLLVKGQEPKNIMGLGAGISPGRDYCIYFGEPVDEWAGKSSSPVFQFFYARQVREAVRLGGYVEYEHAVINNLYNYNDMKASRYNIGFNWLAQYPNKSLHLQLGGYFGYGFIKSGNLDKSLSGIDFGIMAGPAYEEGNLGIALHIQSGFGWYSSSDIKDLDLLMPKILLKVYRKF